MAKEHGEAAAPLTAEQHAFLVKLSEAGELPYDENRGVVLDGLIARSFVSVVDGRTLCATDAGKKEAKQAVKAPAKERADKGD